ncbi:MAG: L-glutamate gamma-semialdehyde dehydrogenase [Caldisericia bacterium]|nr:L-glutamate gamma-semialdehyde dehydrogenase [Caldisericia bacterium]
MNNALYEFQRPFNETIKPYLKGSEERKLLEKELKSQLHESVDIPLIIGGKEVRTGKTIPMVCPHDHHHILGYCHMASEKEVLMAIDASQKAKADWMTLSWVERGSILLKAAELISTKYRYLLNSATMLGQSKNCFQAEIDSACEVIDFLRFNNFFASQIYSDQPVSDRGMVNRLEYRPLEGFILTVSPFNFTAIAMNLNISVILMGNTTVWKPSSTSLFSNYYLMKILMEAGMPEGVINFIPCSSDSLQNTVLCHRDLSGIHFTGSSNTFNHIWQQTSTNLSLYKSYPKLVGETGGKDFIFAHASANPRELATAIVRGAFEYQGQKCSAASRSYIPTSIWQETKKYILEMVDEIKVGDVTDFSTFMNAVIDEKSFNNIMSYIEKTKQSNEATILVGGKGSKEQGYFIEPTVIVTENPQYITMEEEIFGPVMSIFVYPDKQYEETLKICDQTSPYALTGSIFSNDKYAMVTACRILRYAAGNFYINDKPTGAMVGQQPFGGARGSGTNDKSGSYLNLLRWVSPRTIKETLIPPIHHLYPYMD